MAITEIILIGFIAVTSLLGASSLLFKIQR